MCQRLASQSPFDPATPAASGRNGRATSLFGCLWFRFATNKVGARSNKRPVARHVTPDHLRVGALPLSLLRKYPGLICKNCAVFRYQLFAASRPTSGAALSNCRMEGLRSTWTDNKTELLTLLSLSLPASTAYLLNRLVGFTSVLFVGRLGPTQLAAAALGGSLTNVVGFGILNGLTGGMPTLCGQVGLRI